MKIGNTLTGSTSYTIEQERPISALYFVVTRAAAVTDFGADLTATISMKIDANNKETTHIVRNATPLASLAQFTQYGEGSILCNDAAKTAKFLIRLTPSNASIALDGEQRLIVSLAGFLTTDSVELYGLESIAQTDEIYSYDQKNIAAGKGSGLFDVAGFITLLLPITGLEKIELKYISSKSITYLPQELDVLMIEDNDICVQYRKTSATVVEPINTIYVLNVLSAVSADVDTTTDAYTFITVSVQKF